MDTIFFLTTVFRSLFSSLLSSTSTLLRSLIFGITFPLVILVLFACFFIAIGAAQHYFLTSSDIDDDTKDEIIYRLRSYYFDWVRTPPPSSSSSSSSLDQRTMMNASSDTFSIIDKDDPSVRSTPPSSSSSSSSSYRPINFSNTSTASTVKATRDNNIENPSKNRTTLYRNTIDSSNTVTHSIGPTVNHSKNINDANLFVRIRKRLRYIKNHYRIPYILYLVGGTVVIGWLGTRYHISTTILQHNIYTVYRYFIHLFRTDYSSSPSVPSRDPSVPSIPNVQDESSSSSSSLSTNGIINFYVSTLYNLFASLISWLPSIEALSSLLKYVTTSITAFVSIVLIGIRTLLSFRIEILLIIILSFFYLVGTYYSYRQRSVLLQQKRKHPVETKESKKDKLPSSTDRALGTFSSLPATVTTMEDTLVERLNGSIIDAINNETTPRRLSSTTFPLRSTIDHDTTDSLPKASLPTLSASNYHQFIGTTIDSEPSATTTTTGTTTTDSYASPVTAYVPTPSPSSQLPLLASASSSSSSSAIDGLATSPSTATKYSHFQLNPNDNARIETSPTDSILSYPKKSRISLGGFSTLSQLSERTKDTTLSSSTVLGSTVTPPSHPVGYLPSSSSASRLSLPSFVPTGDPVFDTMRMQALVARSTARKNKRQSIATQTLQKLGISTDSSSILNHEILQFLQPSTLPRSPPPSPPTFTSVPRTTTP